MSADPQYDPLDMWVIYDHPTDYPEHWVVRRWHVDLQAPGRIIADVDAWKLADSLHEARVSVPSHLHRIDRLTGDDPRIREVWL